MAFLVLALAAPAALAHALAPALLELREVAPQRYAVLWRTSVARAGTVSVAPRLPEACVALGAPESRIEAGEALVARWIVQCAQRGLVGETIVVDGLAAAAINVVLALVPAQGPAQSTLLAADAPSYTVPAQSAAAPVLGRYLALGGTHLVGGLDHLLFLLGLVVLVRGLRPLVATVTAFTAGHAATLTLVTLGVLQVPQDVAEIAIAATVLVLACELARPRAGPPSLLRQRPWLVAGAFGLIHGLGFAGALREAGLPAGDVPLALLAFNLGIEAAQLAAIGLMLAAVAGLRRLGPGLLQAEAVRQAPAYAIGTLATFWCLERAWALAAVTA